MKFMTPNMVKYISASIYIVLLIGTLSNMLMTIMVAYGVLKGLPFIEPFIIHVHSQFLKTVIIVFIGHSIVIWLNNRVK